jgi:branched-chain amino acid transport system permease protein
MRFLLTTIMLIEVYAIVSMALNLLLGVAGRYSAYEAAMMGVGAYTASLLALNAGFDLYVSCFIAALAVAALAAIFQIMVRHMDFFTFNVSSFALQMVLYETLLKWRDLTEGAVGLFNVPRPELFGVSFTSLNTYMVLTTASAAVIIGFLLYLERSQYALALRGLRDGEKALESLGKNTFLLKITVFAIAGAATGFAGGLLAGLTRTVHPSMFYIYLSVIFTIFVVSGGRGNLLGTVVAVALLTIVEQAVTLIPGLPVSQIGALQRIIYGLILLGVVMYYPNGLFPEKPIFKRAKYKNILPREPGLAFLGDSKK